ncbi:MAG: PilZ domain-containing protein [Thermodesulfobacteriota bacterium]|nr:PilZ domain-containing protein [Thermodesulfobacteriota bacterium]
MENERRRYIRFPVSLKVEAYEENNIKSTGVIQDFSRDGLGAVFDNCDLDVSSYITIGIQRPGKKDIFHTAVKVMWKRQVDDKCTIGAKLHNFSSHIKSEILEHGYNYWIEITKLLPLKGGRFVR